MAQNGEDYICITDMAKAKSDDSRAADVIKNWMRNRTTLEFLGTWEKIYNPNFKVVEFDHFKTEAGLHSFVLSPSQWVEKTNAIGIFSKQGRYGGTFAHKDIAFEFGSKTKGTSIPCRALVADQYGIAGRQSRCLHERLDSVGFDSITKMDDAAVCNIAFSRIDDHSLGSSRKPSQCQRTQTNVPFDAT